MSDDDSMSDSSSVVALKEEMERAKEEMERKKKEKKERKRKEEEERKRKEEERKRKEEEERKRKEEVVVASPVRPAIRKKIGQRRRPIVVEDDDSKVMPNPPGKSTKSDIPAENAFELGSADFRRAVVVNYLDGERPLMTSQNMRYNTTADEWWKDTIGALIPIKGATGKDTDVANGLGVRSVQYLFYKGRTKIKAVNHGKAGRPKEIDPTTPEDERLAYVYDAMSGLAHYHDAVRRSVANAFWDMIHNYSMVILQKEFITTHPEWLRHLKTGPLASLARNSKTDEDPFVTNMRKFFYFDDLHDGYIHDNIVEVKAFLVSEFTSLQSHKWYTLTMDLTKSVVRVASGGAVTLALKDDEMEKTANFFDVWDHDTVTIPKKKASKNKASPTPKKSAKKRKKESATPEPEEEPDDDEEADE